MYDGMDILENDAEDIQEENRTNDNDAHKVEEDIPDVMIEKQMEDARDIKLEQEKTRGEE